MPNSIISSFAEKTKKSIPEVEKLWNIAKESIKKSHPDMKEDNPKFYAMVNVTLKKMLNLDEDAIATIGTATGDIATFQKKMENGPEEKKRKKKWETQIDKFL
jgi:hypothetical protein